MIAVRFFRGTNYDSDQYLVFAEVRERGYEQLWLAALRGEEEELLWVFYRLD